MDSGNSNSPKYRKIADKISSMIKIGTLVSGEKVPSLRTMQKQEKVSIITVQTAYRLLEKEGLIESKPQSGFIVSRRAIELPNMPTQLPSNINTTAINTGDLIAQICHDGFGKKSIPLGTAFPDSALIPHQKIKTLIKSYHAADPDILSDYAPFYGNTELRRLITLKAIANGLSLTDSSVIVTAGAVEAISLALHATTKPGDIVAIESPTYFLVLQAIKARGLRALEIPSSSSSGPDLEFLSRALKRHKISACFITPNFQNPLGFQMQEQNKIELLDILGRKEIPLIEDDVYGDLAFNLKREKPIKAYDKQGLVIYCSSVSKTLGAGLRVGWLISERYAHNVAKLKLATSVSVNTLAQAIVAEALRGGFYARHINRLSHLFARQTYDVIASVVSHFPEGTRISQPKGGFVVWVELPKHFDSMKLYNDALAKSISIAPGPIFSARGYYKNCFRLNAGNLYSPKIEAAIKTLGTLCKHQLSESRQR